MPDLKKQTEAVIKAISDLSAQAKAAGDGDLMWAADRAWTQLYNHQTIMLKDAVRAESVKRTSPQQTPGA